MRLSDDQRSDVNSIDLKLDRRRVSKLYKGSAIREEAGEDTISTTRLKTQGSAMGKIASRLELADGHINYKGKSKTKMSIPSCKYIPKSSNALELYDRVRIDKQDESRRDSEKTRNSENLAAIAKRSSRRGSKVGSKILAFRFNKNLTSVLDIPLGKIAMSHPQSPGVQSDKGTKEGTPLKPSHSGRNPDQSGSILDKSREFKKKLDKDDQNIITGVVRPKSPNKAFTQLISRPGSAKSKKEQTLQELEDLLVKEEEKELEEISKVYKRITQLGYKQDIRKILKNEKKIPSAYHFFNEKLNNQLGVSDSAILQSISTNLNASNLNNSNIDSSAPNDSVLPAINKFSTINKKYNKFDISDYPEFKDMHIRNLTEQTAFFDNNYIRRIENSNSFARDKIQRLLEAKRPDIRKRANSLPWNPDKLMKKYVKGRRLDRVKEDLDE